MNRWYEARAVRRHILIVTVTHPAYNGIIQQRESGGIMNMTAKPDVRIERDALVLGSTRVRFMRTVRIPETGLHALPPGLGTFPLRRIADYPDTAPAAWLATGGVMLPVFQREAMWLSFDAHEPAALQVGVGKVCAVSGEPWSERLWRDPQNYAALPEQPWLDGINAGDGVIRQFVAVPLGSGATVEGQVTGQEAVGGIQLRAVGLTGPALAAWRERGAGTVTDLGPVFDCMVLASAPSPGMGLGGGGRMKQEVYEDDRPTTDYDVERSWRVCVHLCPAAEWVRITGELPPPTPVDRDAYASAGLPWFDYYDADQRDLPAPEALTRVRPVGEVLGLPDDAFVTVPPGQVVVIKDGRPVTDGDW